MHKMKIVYLERGKKLTTIGELTLNDIFSSGIDCEDRWRIISENCFFATRHMYGALAIRITGKMKTKAFRKNQQVVYIKKMIAV